MQGTVYKNRPAASFSKVRGELLSANSQDLLEVELAVINLECLKGFAPGELLVAGKGV